MLELADVVVVGGGIVGLSIAYELAKRPVRVALLEAGALGEGTTGTSFAWLNAASKTEDEAYHRLNANGMAGYRAFADHWGSDALGLHFGGSLSWLTGDDAAAEAEFDRRHRRLQDLGYPVTILQAEEMRVLEPAIHFTAGTGKPMRGLYAPADMWIESAKIIAFLAERARENGADININCPALEFTRDAAGHISTVQTPRGRIATRNIVVAAGLWTPRLLASLLPAGKAVPLTYPPGLLVQTPALPELRGIGRVLYPPDPGGLHFRPEPDGGVLLGADDSDSAIGEAMAPPGEPVGDSNLEGLTRRLTSVLLERLQTVLPSLSLEGLAERCTARIGVRPVPIDGLPIVGPVPAVPGLFVAVTHSGFTLAPELARMLADEIVTGRNYSVLAPYRPSRFPA